MLSDLTDELDAMLKLDKEDQWKAFQVASEIERVHRNLVPLGLQMGQEDK